MGARPSKPGTCQEGKKYRRSRMSRNILRAPRKYPSREECNFADASNMLSHKVDKIQMPPTHKDAKGRGNALARPCGESHDAVLGRCAEKRLEWDAPGKCLESMPGECLGSDEHGLGAWKVRGARLAWDSLETCSLGKWAGGLLEIGCAG